MNDPDFDVFLQGTVFFDVVLTGLPSLPARGTELLAEGMGTCPGGIANLAVAASRLGLRTSLSAGFGDDLYGEFLWRTLEEQEGVDLSKSRRFAGWHSPVTVSLAVQRDRSMVTHAHPSPAWPTWATRPSPGPRRRGPTVCSSSATSAGIPARSGHLTCSISCGTSTRS